MAISFPPAQTSTQALAVHRCRFVDYNPSAISAIAFPPLGLPSRSGVKLGKASGSSQKRKFGTLAVGRANGNIELYEWSGAEYESQAPKAWVLSKILYGPIPSKVDSLAFALRHPYLHTGNTVPSLSDLRLFSAGGGSELVEWDLANGTILRTLNSQGGAIWSLSVNPSNSLLALGCEDGCVRLISLEGDSLQHHRRFDRVKCRVLSIAWGPPVPSTPNKTKPNSKNEKEDTHGETSEGESESDDEDDEWTDSWLVTGGSDSALRKWDVKTGRVLDRMSTDKVRGERTLVWSLGVLANGTIISGDSLGIVKFWDSKTCTQLHSFQAHGADVLCLAIGPDGTSVFTSGVDQKVCLFTHVSLSNPDKTSKKSIRPTSRWVQSTSKRMHSHDVRALAIWPPYLPILPSTVRSSSTTPSPMVFYAGLAPILVSGGLDASLVLAPCAPPSASRVTNPLATSALSTFEDAYHRRVPYPTGLSPTVNVARAVRLVVCAKDTDVSFWRIRGKARVQDDLETYLHSAQEDETDDESRYEKLLDMELDLTTNICASAISPDGRWFAVSDVYEVKLFELTFADDGALRPKRVKTFMPILSAHIPKGTSSSSEGATSLYFTPDSGRLVLGSALSASVLVVDLSARNEDGKLAPSVLRRFDQHRRKGVVFGKGGRLVRKIPERIVNGASASGSEDEGEEMEVDGEKVEENEDSEDGDDSEDEEDTHVVITHMSVSPDGQWLATTDDHCRTHIFNLDAVQHHTSLPTSPSPISALAFSPSSPSAGTSTPSSVSTHPDAQSLILVMAHADGGISVFDVEARRFPEWASHLSRRENLPKRWASLHDSVLGVAFEPPASSPSLSSSTTTVAALLKAKKALPKQTDAFAFAASTGAAGLEGEEGVGQRHALFWGATWLCRVTLDAPVGWGGFVKKRRRGASGSHRHPHSSRPPPSNSGSGAQNKDDDDNDSITNFKLLTRYRPILFVDFLDAGELLVVERPLVDVLRALPPAFFKPRFGT